MRGRRPLLVAVALIAAASLVAGIGVGRGGRSRDAAVPLTRVGAPGTVGGAVGVAVGGSSGVSVRYPESWRLLDPPITSLAYPKERLLLTSYPAVRGGGCAPDRAERQLPPGGGLIYLFEYTSRFGGVGSQARRSDFPRRPAAFVLRPGNLATYECWLVPTYLIRFRAGGRFFQVHVALGPRATPARRAQVLGILDSLRISPAPSAAAAGTSRVTAADLEAALRSNPNQQARSAVCRPATTGDRLKARRVFGDTARLRLFACEIALRGTGPDRFDVSVLPNGCFVGERRRPGQADWGCVARRP